jgi:hypothetical protein
VLKNTGGGGAEEDIVVEAFENGLFGKVGIVKDLAIRGGLPRYVFLELHEKARIFGQDFSDLRGRSGHALFIFGAEIGSLRRWLARAGRQCPALLCCGRSR